MIFGIIFFLIPALLAGCTTSYNVATGEQESLLYGTDKETQIGDSLARQFEEQFKVVPDLDVNERVERILNRIAAVCDRKDLVYSIRVVEEEEVNAISLPGGYVYIFKGLFDQAKTDDQLAGVIAHEVGHITAKHSMKRLQAAYGYTLLQVLAVASRDTQVVQGTMAIMNTLFFAYSQQDEFQADKLAVRYLKRAGFDPQGMVEVLKILQKEQQKRSAGQFSYFRTHPHISERIAMSNQEIKGQIEFRDYLNLTGSE